MKISHLWVIIKTRILFLATEDVKSLKIQLFNLLDLFPPGIFITENLTTKNKESAVLIYLHK